MVSRPRVALNMVTAALVVQSAEALRGLNYDKQNWQQVYSAAGNITVKLPDGTTFTGPSWKYLSDNMATKSGGSVPVNQGGTGSTTASGARTNLGLGNSATRDVGTAAGTVAAGDDSRFDSINGKTGGVILGQVKAGGASPASTPPAGTATNAELIGSRFRSGVYNGIDFSLYAQVVQGTEPSAIFSLRSVALRPIGHSDKMEWPRELHGHRLVTNDLKILMAQLVSRLKKCV